MPRNKRVTVVGGGIAGVSAAIRLALGGFAVTLLERTASLGGRASTVSSGPAPEATDNGQHLAIGAYTDYLETLELLGTRSLLGRAKPLDAEFRFGGHAHSLNCSALPGKLGAASGLLFFGGLSAKSKFGILRFAAQMNRLWAASAGKTAMELLRKSDQTDESIEIFWRPLIVSALNTTPEDASARLFAEVMRLGFFGRADASKFFFPECLLGDLISPAQRLIESKGGRVLFGTKASSIKLEGGLATACVLSSGEVIPSDAIICATKPKDLLSILPGEASSGAEFSALGNLQFSPIVSVYLWSQSRFAPKEMTALPCSLIDWVFSRPQVAGQLCRTAVTVSSATELIGLKESEIIEIVSKELDEYFPEFGSSSPEYWRVFKDKHATFRATREAEKWRPTPATSVPNLFLAGDWTATGLPGTMEGAARSGINAMNLCRNYLILQ